jgi:tripartite-type tricarboxylate transporter receptor subunit TctC
MRIAPAKIAHALAALLTLAAPAAAQAQSEDAAAYPSRTVRIIVPSAPGGPIDSIARILGDALRSAWPVPVVVENKPGAGTSTGGVFVAQSTPDGYTLLVNPDSIAVNPSLYPNLAYHPIKSFEPVALLCTATQVLVVRPDLGVTDLKSFIALAKSRGGGLNIASAGGGTISHLTGVLLEQRAGFKTTHVPFRGAAPALSAMLGGHVDGMWVMLAPAVPHLHSGKLKAVAVTADKRDPELPAVPTAAESGVSDFQVENWQALFAPAGTPKPIVDKIRQTVIEVFKKPEVAGRMRALGFTPRGDAGPAVTELIRTSLPKWAEVVKAANIKSQQ